MRWIKKSFVITTICVMLLILMIPSAVFGDTNTYLQVTPSKISVHSGETFNVDILVIPTMGVNVAGVQFNIHFNPLSLSVNSVTEGNFLKQDGATTFFLNGAIDNGLGMVSNVATVIITPKQSVTKSGIVATINCTAKSSGSVSNFVLTNVIVGNKDGVALPLALAQIAQVTVAAAYDVDGNGLININDLILIGQAFGAIGLSGWIPEDINIDGIINILDLINVAQNLS